MGTIITKVSKCINFTVSSTPYNSAAYTLGAHGSKYYKRIDSPQLSQSEAANACSEDGATLAMPKTQGDAQDIAEMIRKAVK